MLPNRFQKDSQPPHYYPPPSGLNYPASILIPNLLGMDFNDQQKALERAQANLQVNNSIDSLLHVHRRKLQRRAANRKSAQLSRARKKAHLEELTQENTRLQQMVDILESQPELMFCINPRGDITYISERTINFININGANSEGGYDDPTHISQIFSKSSVDDVLGTIQEIIKVSPQKSALAESSMLFSSKVVEFQDSFGHPLVGYLRCARVNRRPGPEDAAEEPELEPALITPTMAAGAKRVKLRQEAEEQELARIAAAAAAAAAMAGSTGTNSSNSSNNGVGSGSSQMDLSNFRLLTECMTTMADSHNLNRSVARSVSQDTSSATVTTANTGTTGSSPRLVADVEADSEFVCVIRTSDAYFARYSTRSDLYMFVSTPLSAEAIEAHDRKAGHSPAKPPSVPSRNSGNSGTSSAMDVTTMDVTTTTGQSHNTSSDTLQATRPLLPTASDTNLGFGAQSAADNNISGQKRDACGDAGEGEGDGLR